MSTFNSQTPLTEDQVINIVREEVESQFPKDCTACGYQFCWFNEYLENTVQIGKPRSYDAGAQNWQSTNPLGIFSFSKCMHCGNTLTLSSSRTNVVTIRQLSEWINKEALQRGITIDDLLDDLRVQIESQVLNQG